MSVRGSSTNPKYSHGHGMDPFLVVWKGFLFIVIHMKIPHFKVSLMIFNLKINQNNPHKIKKIYV